MSFYKVYITPLLTKIFLRGLRAYNVIKDSWIELLDQHPQVYWAVSEARYGIQVIHSFLTATRMESRELPWLATYGIEHNKVGLTTTFSLVESVKPFFSSYFFNDLFGKTTELEYTLRYITIMGSLIGSNLLSHLVVIKGIYKDEFIYLVHRGPFLNNEKPIKPSSWKRVEYPFLSVQYTHPKMNESIELKIDKGFFREGNELFTPAFVLRALEYQSTSYCFDQYYKIKIMDISYNIIELDSNMYVVITENGYECKNEEVFSLTVPIQKGVY